MTAITHKIKALADDTRLEIIRFLLKGKKNVTQIVLHVKKSQPNTSLALKQLMLTNLVEQETIGRERYYKLKNPEKIKTILKLLEELEKK